MPEIKVLFHQLYKFGDDSLHKRCQCNGFLYAHGDITDPEFKSIKERVKPDIIPEFLPVIHTIRFNEEINITIVLFGAAEIIGNSGTRELVEYFNTIRFETC